MIIQLKGKTDAEMETALKVFKEFLTYNSVTSFEMTALIEAE